LLKLIRWSNLDAYYNLAAEEYIFTSLDRDQEYLLLWQNQNAVVVGKHQNTIEEINTAYVKEHGVQVVRRLSGGGAVYHDLGNLNYSFIVNAPEGRYNFREMSQPVADTLIRLGVNVEFSGRNDLVIDGKKISGNAQFISGGRILHHGTLLFHTDLDQISRVLAVKDDKIISKGVKSVRGRVANICEYLPGITVDIFQSHLEETLLGRNLTVYELSEADVAAISTLRNSKYATWEWNYGYSPEYDIKKDRRWLSGGLSIYIKVQKGAIQTISIRGDFFGDGDIEEIEQSLQNVNLCEEDVREALKAFNLDHYIYGITLDELVEMIVS
jgi:lipoate-protein ligase A